MKVLLTHERGRALVLPALVLVVGVAVSLIALFFTRQLVDDQETRLLEERSEQLEALVASFVMGTEAPLRVLAAAYSPDDPRAMEFFASAAEHLQGTGASRVGALVDERDGFHVAASVAPGSRRLDRVTPDRAALAARAIASGSMAGGLLEEDGRTHLSVAVPADGGVVVFQDTPLQPHEPFPVTPGSPFDQLRTAVYASSEPNPAALVMTTEERLPLRGEVLSTPFAVGDDEWSLSVSAREPLVDSFTHNAPWVLFAGGLFVTALGTAVTAILASRRSYALALVEERTAELAAAQRAAEQANRSKSEFLSRMSHELRTPLNAVLGFAQLLELEQLDAEQRSSVEYIRKGGEHLLQLINEVLDISRVESGTISLSPEPVLVDDLVSDVLELTRPLAAQGGLQLVADRTPAWETHVLADRQRAKQVLLNMLSNAVKYNRQRGTVAVACTREGQVVRLAVSDTGPGIRPEALDLVFTPFERLGAEHTDIEGTGIGLALSQRLAEAMGGRITVESVPGEGSTFTLELPAAEGPVERYDRLGGARAAAEPHEHETSRVILYIEDNLSNITLVERVMEQRPEVQVVPAMQGRLGLELARQHRPMLVLLDLHLPDIGGDEVLARLLGDAQTASIPVVIVSADATQGQVQRLLAAGASEYLTKPIDVQQLLALVDRQLTSA